MSDPRTHIDRDFDRTKCDPEEQSPPPDEGWYATEQSSDCFGEDGFNLEDYLVEPVTDTECAAAAAGELFDPEVYLIETVVGGDCEDCCCCACPCCCGVGYWTAYQFTVSGFAPNPGSIEGFCEKFNGTWTVTYTPFGDPSGTIKCYWLYDNGLEGLDQIRFDLSCSEPSTWSVTNAGTGAHWDGVDNVDFVCDCGGTLVYAVGSQEGCDGDVIDATITVTPAPGATWVSCGKEEPECGAFAAALAAETPEQRSVRIAEARAVSEANAKGPGSVLKNLLRTLGFKTTGCGGGCEVMAAKMNAWGVEGCDGEHREEILAWLRAQQAKAGWVAKAKAAALAVASGLAFKLDPTDPAPGLLDEAIRLAAQHVNDQTSTPPDRPTP